MNTPSHNSQTSSSPEESASSSMNAILDELRCRIDDVDSRIVACLAERQAIVEEVVALKKKHHMPVYHPAREENLISEKRRKSFFKRSSFVNTSVDVFRGSTLSTIDTERVWCLVVRWLISATTCDGALAR